MGLNVPIMSTGNNGAQYVYMYMFAKNTLFQTRTNHMLWIMCVCGGGRVVFFNLSRSSSIELFFINQFYPNIKTIITF